MSLFGIKITRSIITALGVMMLLSACSGNKGNAEILEYEGRFPDESAENMTITVSDSGRVNFVLSTPMMNRYYGEDSTFTDFPKGVKVTSFNDYGERQAIITAEYANQLNNSFYRAEKHVVIYDIASGDSVITEEVVWDQRSHKIYSDKQVKQVKSDGSVNYGDGFTADERFTKYTIIHPHGEINGYDF